MCTMARHIFLYYKNKSDLPYFTSGLHLWTGHYRAKFLPIRLPSEYDGFLDLATQYLTDLVIWLLNGNMAPQCTVGSAPRAHHAHVSKQRS